jgi:hypothetical protein
VAHFKTQHVIYRKNSAEWEVLGDLGFRLHHKEEAKEAYQRCLDQRFSFKAWMKLLEMYADEGDLGRTLNAAIRLTVYHHRYVFSSSLHPTRDLRLYVSRWFTESSVRGRRVLAIPTANLLSAHSTQPQSLTTSTS